MASRQLVVAGGSTDLGTLGQKIKSEYEQAIKDRDKAVGFATSAMTHALAAGHLLNEAKTQTKHGHWLPWLEQIGIPRTTAADWMRLARNERRVVDLNVGEALKRLAEPKEKKGKPAPVTYSVIEQDRYDEMPTDEPPQTLGEIAEGGTDGIIRPQRSDEEGQQPAVQAGGEEGKSVTITLPLDPAKAARLLRRYFPDTLDELIQELEELTSVEV